METQYRQVLEQGNLFFQNVPSQTPACTLKLNGIPFAALLDTGADITIVNSQSRLSTWPTEPDPQP